MKKMLTFLFKNQILISKILTFFVLPMIIGVSIYGAYTIYDSEIKITYYHYAEGVLMDREEDTIYDGSKIRLDDKDYDEDGYRFIAWYLDEEFKIQYDLKESSLDYSKNIKLYARYDYKIYQVNYVENEDEDPGTDNIEHGSYAHNRTASKDDHVFMGWYEDKEYQKPYDFNSPVTKNLTLYAYWEELHDVIIDGYDYLSFELIQNTKIYPMLNDLTIPTEENKTFDGWYVDKEKTIPVRPEELMPNENLTIFIKWKDQHSLKIYDQDELKQEIKIHDGDSIFPYIDALESSLQKTGYKIEGFYYDEEFKHQIEEKATFYNDEINNIYIKYDKLFGVSVYFEDEVIANLSYVKDENLLSLLKSYEEKNGFIHDGWFYDETLENKVEEKDIYEESITHLYSKWYSDGLSFRNDEYGNAHLSKVENYSTYIIIPDTYNNKPVVGIDDRVFLNNKTMKEIKLPNGLISIGESTFSGTLLESISFPTTLTSIGSSAFKNTDRLTQIILPEGITTIEEYTFADMSNLESITFSTTLTVIEAHAFENNSKVIELDIPNGVTEIGEYAFFGLSKITNLELPDGLLVISSHAFANMTGLKSIKLPSGLTTIGYYGFSKTGLETIDIPNSVTEIKIGAFSFNTSMTEITIPASVINISDNTFEGMTSLKSINIQGQIESIGDYAFSNTSLSTISIPNSVRDIGEYAFNNIKTLNQLVIPASVETIGKSAFSGMTTLTTLTLPFIGTSHNSSEIESTLGYLFGDQNVIGTTKVTQNNVIYYIPTSLLTINVTSATIISDYAFQNVTFVESINLNSNLTTIGVSAFENTTNLKIFSIPYSVTTIGTKAFKDAASLTQLYIPSTVSIIEPYTFEGMTSLKSINIQGQIESIGDYAFSNTSLSTISIPNSVRDIGEYAFNNIKTLNQLVIPASVETIGKSAFSGMTTLTTLTLPFIGTSHNSSEIESTLGYLFGDQNVIGTTKVTQNNVIYYIPTSLLTINVTSATIISDYAFQNVTFVESINLNSNLTTIGVSAFENTTNLKIFSIPYSVTTIGTKAFKDAASLTQLYIPSTVSIIEPYTFSGTSSLRYVYIPYSITEISEYAFFGASSLSSIIVPNSVISIGDSAFNGMSSLQSISLPFVGNTPLSTGSNSLFGYVFGTTSYTGSTSTSQYYTLTSYATYYIPTSLKTINITGGTKIEYGAFSGLSNVTGISIPNTVTSIGDSAFNGMSSLQSISLPFVGNTPLSTGSNSLFGYVFGTTSYTGGSATMQMYAPTSLMTYYIPTSLKTINITGGTKIEYGAFSGLSNVTGISIPNTVTSIGDSAFNGMSSLQSISLPFVGNTPLSTGSNSLFGYVFGTTSYTGGSATMQMYAPTSLMTYYIPTSLKTINITGGTKIEYGAFSGLSNVTGISIPNTVTSIGDSAFNGMSSLQLISLPFVGNTPTSTGSSSLFGYVFGTTSYTGSTSTTQYYTLTSYATYYIPTSLKTINITGGTKIEYGAFSNLSNVTSITIPNTVQTIGTSAFNGMSSVTTLTIPDSVTSIGDSAFRGMSSVTSLTIPDSVTSIGTQAFYGMSSVTTLTIPDSVTSIGDSAFRGMSSVTSLTIPDSVTSIGTSAFSGMSSVTSLTIPDSVTSIGTQAFYGMSSVTTLTIPDSVTSIGDYAFYNMSSVNSFTISNSVTSIGTQAFYGMSSVTTLTIPDSVTSIGDSAFRGMSSLESITLPFVGNTPTSTGSSSLFGYIFGTTSYTGSTSTTQYYTSTSYSYATYYIPTSLKTINITGGTKIEYGAFSELSNVTSINIPTTVTTIGDSAFKGMSSVTSLTIPDSVTSIGDSAFRGMSSLQLISLPFVGNTPTSTGSSSLFGYVFGTTNYTGSTLTTQYYKSTSYFYSYATYYIPTSLKTINITGGTKIEYGAFSELSNVTSINIPTTVTTIGDSAFKGMSSVTSLTIPDSVTSIGDSAFNGMSSLQSISLPFVGNTPLSTGSNSLFGYVFGTTSYTGSTSTTQYYTLTSYATYYIPTSLKTINITGGTKIEYGAFSELSNVTAITIPSTITSIGNLAFSGLASVESIDIHNVNQMGTNVFNDSNNILVKLQMTKDEVDLAISESRWSTSWLGDATVEYETS